MADGIIHTSELPWDQAERGTPPAIAPCLASPPGLSLTSFLGEHTLHQSIAIDALAPGLLGESHLEALRPGAHPDSRAAAFSTLS